MTRPAVKEQIGKILDWQSVSSATPPDLGAGELHLWFVPLCLNNEQQDEALTLLNDTQRDKYHRRATPALQHSYLAGRYHLMTLLGAYNSIPASRVQISYSRLNKPYLNPNPEDIQFNFTDTQLGSSSVALFAFTRSNVVGVDIESLSRLSNFAAIVEKRFTQAEAGHVTNKDGSINARRFLAYWTRKEAYGKATGQGINFKMNEMDLASPNAHDLKFEGKNKAADLFSLQQIQIDDDLISTVVHEGHHDLTIHAFKG